MSESDDCTSYLFTSIGYAHIAQASPYPPDAGSQFHCNPGECGIMLSGSRVATPPLISHRFN